MVDEKLPDAELEVLACLWREGEATARVIQERLASFRPMLHQSVVTLLKRLEDKELVRKEKGPVGKAFVYKPTKRPGKTYRRIVGDLLERVFGGDGVALVTSLFQSRKLEPHEIEELQQLLDEQRLKAEAGSKAVSKTGSRSSSKTKGGKR